MFLVKDNRECARTSVSMVKRLLSLFILYPLVYPPMALAASFDRVFLNPFLRQRLPARRSVHPGTPLQSLYACLSRPHASIYRAACHVCLSARARVWERAYPGIRGALIPF